MYINQTYQTIAGNECVRCRHDKVCKWKSEKLRVDKVLSDIKVETFAPISLSANCKSFEKEPVTGNLISRY